MHPESKYLAVKISHDLYAVKFGSHNKEFIACFSGEKAMVYATDYANAHNKMIGINQ